ncbi:MAG: OmpA family protein [Rhizobiaceae bacterium]|nr:OmpA family protein [Rhizobiaceae bacterium]
MTFRSLILIGSVSTIALMQSAYAEKLDAQTILAQAEAPVIIEDEAAKKAAQEKAEAEAAAAEAAAKAAAEEAAAAEAAAKESEAAAPEEAPAREKRREKGRKAQEQAEQPATEAPAAEAPAATEAAPAQPSEPAASEAQPSAEQQEVDNAREKRRAEREKRRQERAQQAAEPTAPPAAETPAAEAPTATEAAPAQPSEPAATEAQPSADQQEVDNAREKRRAEREKRRQERMQQAAEPTAPASGSDSGLEKAPEERQADRKREREKRRAERQTEQTAPVVDKSASPVEQQIGIQGGEEQLRELRRLREKLDREREVVKEEQVKEEGQPTNNTTRADRRRDRRDGRGDRGEVVESKGDRIIIRLGDQLVIEPQREGDRLLSRSRDVVVEDLGHGDTRTTVFRDNGVRVITERDRYGDILTRVRVLPNGTQIVLIDNTYVDRRAPRRDNRPRYYGEIEQLPPLVIGIPEDQYIVETRAASRRQVQEALVAPPVERVERAYTLDEVRYSERLRDKVRRVDLDTITFDFGSAAVSVDQLDALDNVGLALEAVLAKNPDEVFLIEGHTDAVGTDEANLLLSDRRAEAVAVALSEDFDIPPENLVTQGYGEQQLKVNTSQAERENRRVAIRRITPLLRASK